MIRLDTVNRSLRIVLSGTITTNQLPVTVAYSDKTSTSYSGGTQLSTTNSTTPVTICSAPAASTVRDIDYINIYNADTVAATVVVSYLDTATSYSQHDVTLQVDDTLTYTHAAGWVVTSKAGTTIQVTSVFGRTGAVTAQVGDYATHYAALAGLSTQAFSTAALTTTGLFDISGASAGQIKFPATQNASADPNTLDDYEEGTFTPAYSLTTPGTSSFGTYATQTGNYVKCGSLVTVNAFVQCGTFSLGTGSGTLQVSIPFAANASYSGGGVAYTSVNYVTLAPMTARVAAAASVADFRNISGATVTAITSANCASSLRTEFVLDYQV